MSCRHVEACLRSVILLASYSPSLPIFRSTLIKQLRARGHRVIACGPADRDVEQALDRLGAEFRSIGPRRTSLNPLHDLAYLFALLRLMIRERPCGVIAYTAKPVIWGGIAAWIARVRIRALMITGLGRAFGDTGSRSRGGSGLIRCLYRFALRRASAVICQNPDDLRALTDAHMIRGNRGHVVNGSGVETDLFLPAALPRRQIFLMIARLLAEKGVREFAIAARSLRSEFPAARFRLAGWFDDSRNGVTESELAKWHAEGSIEFLGKLDDVRPAIAASDVFVLPSYYGEGIPRTILEAMSMGRPIVTTDMPGCRETVVPDRNGFLVKSRDAGQLAEVLKRFLVEDGLAERMGRESRRLAVERFDASDVARSVIDAAQL